MKVLAGTHEKWNGVFDVWKGLWLQEVKMMRPEKMPLDKTTIESYEVITEDVRKSAASGIARGAVGAAFLGPIGLLAGVSAKNKSDYTVAVQFKDGSNDLLQLNKKEYEHLLKVMF